MALPYKLFKSLTIDGTTMGLDPDLGKSFDAGKANFAFTPNTPVWTDGVTIPEDGLYILEAAVLFATPTSTGATVHTAGYGINGKTYTGTQVSIDAWALPVNKRVTRITELNAGDVVYFGATCDKATASGCNILGQVVKLIKVAV